MTKTSQKSPFLAVITAVVVLLALHFSLQTTVIVSNNSVTRIDKISFRHKLPRAERKKARGEYFNMLMRDPATGVIPPLAHVHELEWKKKSQIFKNTTDKFDWIQAGPNTVGGRTRAFAFDVQNPQVIITGGVSGGIWKSIDKGLTWTQKTPEYQNMNLTWVAQDTRAGFQDTWYAVTGEFDGNSTGYPASGYRGHGVFKSTDNGESWQLLSSGRNPDITRWNSAFDYMSKIVVNPANGDVYVASHAGVLLKSSDGGDSWTTVFGKFADFQYVDVVITTNGRIIASLSGDEFDNDPAMPNKGIYYSDDNGSSWTSITPATFPATFYRTVLALAPSNQAVLYALTQAEGQNVHLFKLNHVENTSSDRTSFIPVFEGLTADYFNTQGNYNMVVSVKPDDENFVVIGGVNLYRSTNGFANKQFAGASPTAAELSKIWIGGYTKNNNSYANYPNQHADQHIFVFDPENPNAGWSGHDGGISYTSNISASSVSWVLKNDGYFVTQFYHISLSRSNGERTLLGGAQDNGSPIFEVSSENSQDASTGDGAYSYLGTSRMYASSQLGTLQRYTLNTTTNVFNYTGEITPEQAEGQLFIHPYEADKNNGDIIYYPSRDGIFRTTDAAQFGNQSWTDLRATFKTRNGLTITALASSVKPANILYFAGSDRRQGAQLPPYVYKVTNANTASTASAIQELTLPNAPNGSYVSSIAVNPEDANEVLVTLSNYNVEGIFYSSNGSTFTQVEGNLRGSAATPGPSIRSAAITTVSGVKVYVVGTTTGVYTTTLLNGNSTVWIEEGKNTVGNAIVTSLSFRETDSHIAAGTHGRGAFYGTPSGSMTPLPEAVSLVQPANNAEDVDTRPVLRWTPSTNASTYIVEYSKMPNFSTQVTTVTNIATDSVKLNSNLNVFTNYYWRVRAVNATGVSSWSSIFTFKTNAPAPELFFPANDQANISIAPQLGWNSVQANLRFQLQVSTNSAFSTTVKDTTVINGQAQLNGLSGNTTYYWRARVNETAGLSEWSEAFRFSTRLDPAESENTQVTANFDFGDSSSGSGKPDRTDYKLVSLPGEAEIPLAQVFTGEYKSSWRAFLDNGAELNNYEEYSSDDQRFRFKAGNGFWVLSKDIINSTVTVTPVTVNGNDQVEIPLQQGWNIISNPFQKAVSWVDIQTANSLSANLWRYSEFGFEKATQLNPFEAYYFFNNPIWNRTSLSIPYTSTVVNGSNPFTEELLPESTPQLTFHASFDTDFSGTVSVVYESMPDELARFEKVHPDLNFVSNGMILKPTTDSKLNFEQLTDSYSASGNEYQLHLKANPQSLVFLTASSKNLPENTVVLLVNRLTKKQWLVKTSETVGIEITEPLSTYDVYAGTEDFIQTSQQAFIPQSFTLSQNYPNPFNPSTTIRYSIAQQSPVLLEVFDINGRLVKTLVNNQIQSIGWYAVPFDASNLSSGVYIYRLQAGNQTMTQKMLLVK